MKEYIYKQPIEACQYKEGMETGWEVLFTGNLFDYSKRFKTKKEALRFIETNEGINYVDIDDTHFQIDYEEPIPYLWDVINYKQDIYHKDDYIIRYPTGRIEILSKKEFESLFEEVENNNSNNKDSLIPDNNVIHAPFQNNPLKLIHKDDGFHIVNNNY